MVLAGLGFLGNLFSLISMGFVGVLVFSYYLDYKKNKTYYTESFVFWAILILGAALIHLIFTVFMNQGILAWSICGVWFTWVVIRLGNTEDKNKQP
jgi:cellulose synthase/poly-beta-1,6-N-acetylglucosamine synthase-like glycosyltransferase